MNNKKVVGLLLSLALIIGVVVPGTLAASAEDEGAASVIATDGETAAATQEETEENRETGEENVSPTDEILYSDPEDESATVPTVQCSCGTQTDTHEENCPLYEEPAEETPVCTCDAENGVHGETCPLYVPQEPQCTCGTEGDEHEEDCPLYQEPERSVYERLMAAETKEEFDAIIAEIPEEDRVFTCEQFDDLEARYYFLSTGETLDRSPIVDEVSTTVNFTNVAPLAGTNQ